MVASFVRSSLATLICAGVISARGSFAAPVVDPAENLPAFELHDGDRVVLLGGTFIERDQQHGYFEAALVSRFHASSVQFRNLGWSGDNVWGEARAGFGTVADGFEQLKKHVQSIRPTVILLNYGANEAFAGPGGLDAFLSGLDALLSMLYETGARLVFIAPLRQEDLGRPLPDPAAHNRDLKLYGDAIAKVAAARRAPIVNLYELLGSRLRPTAGALTDNGIHFTGYGYWRAASVIEQALALPPRHWHIDVDVLRQNVSTQGVRVGQPYFSAGELRFQALDDQLPWYAPPDGSPIEGAAAVSPRLVRVAGLFDGQYLLKIAGQDVCAATAQQWLAGVALTDGPDFAQSEALRRAIQKKNLLYFYRWRPQNETYLFGFRKHEQGQNAVEIPQFDPLVAAEEARIRQLCVPVSHEYQITRVTAP